LYNSSKVILPKAAPPQIKLSLLLVLSILSILLFILFTIATAEGWISKMLLLLFWFPLATLLLKTAFGSSRIVTAGALDVAAAILSL
jgi:hypothetical protein